MKKGSNGTDDNTWATLGRYFALLSSVPAAILAAYGIGDWLDSHLGTHYLKIVFIVLGTAAGFVPIFHELNKND